MEEHQVNDSQKPNVRTYPHPIKINALSHQTNPGGQNIVSKAITCNGVFVCSLFRQEVLQMQRDRETRHKCEISHLKRFAVEDSRFVYWVLHCCNHKAVG